VEGFLYKCKEVARSTERQSACQWPAVDYYFTGESYLQPLASEEKVSASTNVGCVEPHLVSGALNCCQTSQTKLAYLNSSLTAFCFILSPAGAYALSHVGFKFQPFGSSLKTNYGP